MTDAGRKILSRLGALVESLKKGDNISERFTCHRVELNLEPQFYTPKLVKETRGVLGLSQALFAQFLGVSRKAVSAWEQGINTPNDTACRFMDEIRANPDYWKCRFQKCVKVKV